MAVMLALRVQPGAKKEGFCDVWNGTHLKVVLRAPAIDGKANTALISFLAKELDIKKSSIFIVTGETSRCKLIRIETDEQKEREIELWWKQKF